MVNPSFKRGGEEEDKDDYEGSGRGGGGGVGGGGLNEIGNKRITGHGDEVVRVV